MSIGLVGLFWIGLFILAVLVGVYALGYQLGRRLALEIVSEKIGGTSMNYIAEIARGGGTYTGVEVALHYALAVIDSELAGGRPLDDSWKELR